MESTTRRSPLPLVCTGQETSKIIETVRDNDGRWVADCVNGYGRLFAAAPDLLDACKALCVFFGTYSGDGARAVREQALAALAKAGCGASTNKPSIPSPAGSVIEMRLCEQNHVILKPNQLYIFTTDHACPRCVEIERSYQQ